MIHNENLKILFMGRKDASAQSLEWLLSRQDIDVVGILTDSHLSVSPTAEVAKKHGIKSYTFDEALDSIDRGNLNFDLGVSMLFWRILKGGFISHPSLGVINFHPAPLPDYKGTGGYNIAILEDLKDWQVTAHYVDESIDTGPIIDSISLSLCSETETAKSLEARCQPLLFELFKKVIGKAIEARCKLPAYPNEGGVYISRRRMEEMKEVKEGDDIERKIRAFWFPPYDGAYLSINGEKYTLVNRLILENLAEKNSSSLFTSKRNKTEDS